MRLNKLVILSVVCLLAFTRLNVSGNSNNSHTKNALEQETWEKVVHNKDYSENYKEIKPREPKKRRNWSLFPEMGGTGLVKILVYALVIAVLVFLLYLLLKYTTNFFQEKIPKNKDEIDIEKIEENLHKSDLEKLLELALSKKDYKLAIRIQYLMIIKKLSEFKWIEWKKDKTNGLYVYEMTNKPQGNAFRAVTKLFDRIWYGDIQLTKEIYDNVNPAFSSLLTDIKYEA